MGVSMERKIIILIALIILFFSCEKQESCLMSVGKYSEIIIPLDSIDRLYVEGRVNLYLIKDSIDFLKIKGGENLINGVSINQKNYELKIKDKNKCYWLRNYKHWIDIETHYRNINYINPEIYGEMIFENTCIQDTINIEVWDSALDIKGELNVNRFIFRSHGGNVGLYITGQSKYLYTYLHGAGPQHLEYLCSDNLFVNSCSYQNIYVCVNNVLWVDINSNGNVYFRGNPSEKNFNYKGSGKVLPLE
jgi:hypothetical protein